MNAGREHHRPDVDGAETAPTVPHVIALRGHADGRGKLGFVEALPDTGFLFRRLYFLYEIEDQAARGAHAHKALRQLMIALHGSFRVTLKGRGQDFEFTLDNPREGLLIPPGYWRDLDMFSGGAVCLVAASDEYDEDDYIRNYDDFIAWEQQTGRL